MTCGDCKYCLPCGPDYDYWLGKEHFTCDISDGKIVDPEDEIPDNCEKYRYFKRREP